MNKIIGLDVSKNWLDICVYNTRDKLQYHRFANDASGHEEMITLAREQANNMVNLLEDTKLRFVKNWIIITSKYIRSIHIVLILLVNR